MNFKFKSVLVVVLGLLFLAPLSAFAVPCKNVLIYYTSWSKYNTPAYNFTSIPYSHVTHIAYAFIEPNNDGSLSITGDYMGADGVHYDGVSMIAAAHAAGVKVLLSCGGSGTAISNNYTTISASSSLISTFASNLLAYCQANNFDGVDIDWEFPNTSTLSAQYDNLLAGIRAKMPSPQWTLTAAVSADSYEPTFLNISTINNYLSFFNLMVYDYHGSWLTHSGDNASLFEDSQDPEYSHTASGVTAVNYYLSNGASASKINYGLPFYGYGFNTAGLYQNCGGNCTTTTLTYAQIEPLVGVGWTRNWDSTSDSPNITYNSGVSVISYDDSQSVSIKAAYAINNLGLAGVFAWSADQDYNGSTQPLLDAMYAVASAGCAPTSTPTITPTSTNTATVTSTFTPVVSSTWRINAGGPNYTDTSGNLWVADTNYSGGTAATATGTVGGTTDPTLYASQRYGTNFSYTFDVPAGSYQVTLKFAETYSGDDKVGARVFNVLINGTTVLPNFDIYAAGGANTAVNEVLNNISPSGGIITIQFVGTASSDANAVVEALQVVSMPSTSTPTRTSTATFTLTSLTTATSTSTSTIASIATSTATSTATRSMTATLTSTPVFMATSTSTSTSTPVISTTPVMTATSTNTKTSSATSTSTETLTKTSIMTSTETSNPTSANTAPMTKTFTTTSTETSSPTNANTVAFTKTATTTVTSTMTQAFTAANSQTSTFTAQATNTTTPTSTGTATLTVTNTATLKVELPTSTPTVTSTVTVTATTLGCGGVAAWNGSFVPYSVGQEVSYNGEIYQCLQAHTSQISWTPPATPLFWKDMGPCGLSPMPSVTVPIMVYPNPVTGDTTTVSLPMTSNGDVTIQIYTIAMRLVRTINVPPTTMGSVSVNLIDKSGIRLANGLYYFRVKADGQYRLLKVLILR